MSSLPCCWDSREEKKGDIKVNLLIEDSLGLNSGILIQNVKTIIEAGNKLTIYGQMRRRENKHANLYLEPDVACDLVDLNGAVLFNTVSKHHGYFWASTYTTFEIIIENLKQEIVEQICTINLHLIFQKGGI